MLLLLLPESFSSNRQIVVGELTLQQALSFAFQANDIYVAFDLYGIAFLQTFLPFVTLVSLNIVIIRRLFVLNSRIRRTSMASLVGIQHLT